jgi:hypothetical protein
MAEPGVHGVFFKNAVLHGFRVRAAEAPGLHRPGLDSHHRRGAGQGHHGAQGAGPRQGALRRRVGEVRGWPGASKMGTPLEMWPRMTPGMVATLEVAQHPHRRGHGDPLGSRCAEGRHRRLQTARTEAQSFLNSAAQASAVMEVERLQATVDTQAQQIAELTALVKEAAAREAAREAVRESVQPAPRSRKKAETA